MTFLNVNLSSSFSLTNVDSAGNSPILQSSLLHESNGQFSSLASQEEEDGRRVVFAAGRSRPAVLQAYTEMHRARRTASNEALLAASMESLIEKPKSILPGKYSVLQETAAVISYFWEPERKEIDHWLESCGIYQVNHDGFSEEAITAFRKKILYIQGEGFFREDTQLDLRNASETAKKTVPWRIALIDAFKKGHPDLSEPELEKLENTKAVLDTYALLPFSEEFPKRFYDTLSSTGYAAIETGGVSHSKALFFFQKSGKYVLQILNRHGQVAPVEDEALVSSLPHDKFSLAASYIEREKLIRLIRYDRKLESVLNLPPGVTEENIVEHLPDDFYQEIHQYRSAVQHFIGGKKLTMNNAYFFLKESCSPGDVLALLQKVTGLPQPFKGYQIAEAIGDRIRAGELEPVPTLLVNTEEDVIGLLDTGSPDEFMDQTNTPQRGNGCFNRTNDYVMEGIMGTKLFVSFTQFVRDLAKPVFEGAFRKENITLGKESFSIHAVGEENLWNGGWK